jgi:hypothetical protein
MPYVPPRRPKHSRQALTCTNKSDMINDTQVLPQWTLHEERMYAILCCFALTLRICAQKTPVRAASGRCPAWQVLMPAQGCVRANMIALARCLQRARQLDATRSLPCMHAALHSRAGWGIEAKRLLCVAYSGCCRALCSTIFGAPRQPGGSIAPQSESRCPARGAARKPAHRCTRGSSR